MEPHTVKIELPEPLGGYVRQLVSRGEFASEGDFLRELVRRDRDLHTAQAVRALVEEGLSSGPATPLTDAELGAIRERIASSRQ